MRFRGGGVGHKSTREATDFFKKDRDRLDMGQKPNVPEYKGDLEQEDSEMVSEEHVNENEEDDFGYVYEESDESEGEDELAAEDEDDDFGPEDDGGVIDPDMMSELGYGDL
jgi:hypothetical protein